MLRAVKLRIKYATKERGIPGLHCLRGLPRFVYVHILPTLSWVNSVINIPSNCSTSDNGKQAATPLAAFAYPTVPEMAGRPTRKPTSEYPPRHPQPAADVITGTAAGSSFLGQDAPILTPGRICEGMRLFRDEDINFSAVERAFLFFANGGGADSGPPVGAED